MWANPRNNRAARTKQGGQCANREHRPRPARERPKRSNGAPRNGKICAPCMIWGGRAQRKGPPPGKIFARCIPRRLFAGLFGCTARISCQSQLILDAWRRYVAANWRFSRPRSLRERMKRKSCHGSPPGNAPKRNLATIGRWGTHFACILPSASAPGGCITARSCHGSPPQEYSSTTSCREGPRLPGLAAKSQWRHVAGRHRPSEASANSTTHADTSKKP